MVHALHVIIENKINGLVTFDDGVIPVCRVVQTVAIRVKKRSQPQILVILKIAIARPVGNTLGNGLKQAEFKTVDGAFIYFPNTIPLCRTGNGWKYLHVHRIQRARIKISSVLPVGLRSYMQLILIIHSTYPQVGRENGIDAASLRRFEPCRLKIPEKISARVDTRFDVVDVEIR